jgi:hypothetical protein
MGNARGPRRSFTEEYKAEVVELCRTSGKSIGQAVLDLGPGSDGDAMWGRPKPRSTLAGALGSRHKSTPSCGRYRNRTECFAKSTTF